MLGSILKYILILFLVSCGGGGSSPPTPVQTVVVSKITTQSPFVYVDGNWQTTEDITGKWVVRGTTEDDAFMPAVPVWYGPSDGPTEPRTWWKLYTSTLGIHSEVDKVNGPELNFYSGSFINDAFSVPVPVSKHPVVHIDYELQKFTGNKARATIGITLQFSNGTYYYLERNIKRTESFKLCPNVQYDRCTSNITYFPPSTGAIDVRSLLLQSSNLDSRLIDTMGIIGVYIGSEIYGQGSVHLLVKDYKITING